MSTDLPPRDGHYLVTGASSGVGAAIATALCAQGATVWITARREDALKQLQSEHGPRMLCVAGDLSQADERERIAKTVRQRSPALDGIVHNAGRLEPVGPALECSLEDWRQHQAINVEPLLFLTAALRDRLRPGSRILSISSGAALKPIAGWGAYCTGKAAQLMLTRVLANELGPLGIGVAALRPGLVDTAMQARIRQLDERAFPDVDAFRRMHKEGQLKSPEQIAAFACQLLLDTPHTAFHDEFWDINDAHSLAQ